MSPFSDPLYTNMSGIGLGIARESDCRAVKFLAPLIGLAGAVLLHAVWQLFREFGVVFFAAYIHHGPTAPTASSPSSDRRPHHRPGRSHLRRLRHAQRSHPRGGVGEVLPLHRIATALS